MPRNPQVHFRLKPKDEDGKSLIYLQFLYNKNRLFFSFGQKIKPSSWNENKQRVKSNRETTADGKYSLNDLLDNLEKVCEKSYHQELKNGIPQPEKLKRYLEEVINQNDENTDAPTLFKLIDRFIGGEIKYRGRNKSPNTIKTYRTLKGHLLEFQSIYKYPVTFESITLDFFYKFVDFLGKRTNFEQRIKVIRAATQAKNKKVTDLAINAISKDIQILKVFMSEAVDLGYTNNMQFMHKKFSIVREDTDAVYLSEKELDNLYKFDLSNNKKLENVRDLFVFGAWVGLRFSDFSNIKPENIVEIEDETGKSDYFIKITTQKTKELVFIPCNPVVLDIFKRYDYNSNKLPYTISNQKFNDYIKEVCNIAGFTEKGRLADNIDLELWQCIGSHTARRSFATNYYLQGFPTIDLMKITGHKTEKSFMRYIKVTKLDAAKRLSAHMKKRWSEKMLRVAS
jgi:integrase